MVIKPKDILVYCDFPLVLTASNKNSLFLCMAVAEQDYPDYTVPYLCVEITKETLKNLLARKTDLKEAFSNPKTVNWYICEFDSDKAELDWLTNDINTLKTTIESLDGFFV